MSLQDIKILPEDGYLIIPLSMSRLTTPGQSPQACYEILEHLADKCEKLSNDVIFLYTSDLYFNATDAAFTVRKKVIGQLIAHRNGMQNIILKKKRFIPNAFHYLTFDYVIANSDTFQEFFDTLWQTYQQSLIFKQLVNEGLDGREISESNIRFLLEETAVSHIIRAKLVLFPRTLVRHDRWRLIAYPDPYLKIDAYIWKNKILPIEPEQNIFAGGVYDSKARLFYKFDEVIVS
ncbi:hypothetical protein KJ590_03225 [Patescibacteria group bacterium]|nr:hypothetical protein [Patescibacteria group bacterium]